MATAIITEYRQLAQDANGHTVPVGQEPAIASQSVTYTTSTQSAALSEKTRFVRIVTDADAHINVGTSPSADTSDTRIEANVAEYFGVDPRAVEAGNVLIAFYDGTS